MVRRVRRIHHWHERDFISVEPQLPAVVVPASEVQRVRWERSHVGAKPKVCALWNLVMWITCFNCVAINWQLGFCDRYRVVGPGSNAEAISCFVLCAKQCVGVRVADASWTGIPS